MNKTLIEVFERSEKASNFAKSEFLPGVIYDTKGKSEAINLNRQEALKALYKYGERAILNISYKGEKSKALVRALEREHIDGTIIHIDLQRVSENEVVSKRVPILYEGKKSLKSKGLYIQEYYTSVEVEGRVKDIPNSFIVNLSNRERGGIITISDLNFGENIKSKTKKQCVFGVISRL